MDTKQLAHPVLMAFIVVLAALVPAASHANPVQVADINTTPELEDNFFCGSSYLGFREVVLFCGRDVQHGEELWVSDGTVAGTQLLVDLNPGPVNGDPGGFTEVDGLVYFVASTEEHGAELWVTDGTAVGTRRVAIDHPELEGAPVRDLTTRDGVRLAFAVSTPSRGWEPAVLWSSALLTLFDVVPGPDGSDPRDFAVQPTTYTPYCAATTPEHGREVFRLESTAPVALDLVPGAASSSPKKLTFLPSGELVFSAEPGGIGRELVSWDPPSSTTVETFDLEPGSGSSSPESLVVQGSVLCFSAETTTHGRELWKLKLPRATRVTDINPGEEDGLGFTEPLVPFGDRLCFAAESSSSGQELWCYTEASGAELVGNIAPGQADSYPQHLMVHDGELVFSADSGTGTELYSTDGTPSGTQLMADFNAGSSSGSFPIPMASWRATLIVRVQRYLDAGDIPILAAVSGPGLWSWLSVGVTDASSVPTTLTPDGDGGLLLTAYRADLGREPWLIDDDPLRLMADVVSGAGGSDPRAYATLSERTLVNPRQYASPGEPLVFDGASVVPIDLRTGGDSWPQGIVSLGNVALTSATNAASWSVLWAIDPVAETGVELTINPVNYWMSIQAPAIAAGDTAFFTIDDELWTTDGTPGGTSVVEPVGRIDGNIAVLRAGDGAVKPLVLLFARDSSSGLISPWVSDGTPAGTSLLPVGLAFEDNGDLGDMVRAGSRVLFVGQVSGSEYAELFVTDGTVLGTSQLTDRAGGGDFDSAYQPQILSAVNGSWLYTDTQTSTGTELWVTDGATTELIEITPGATSSLRGAGGDGAATVLGDRVVFSAFTPAAGAELWASDGSADGTELLGEVLPGPAGQWVRPVATGDRVYFAAVGPEGDGEELWMWASPAPPQLSAAGSSPGIVSTAGPLQVEVVVTDDDGGLPSTIRARSAGAWHTMTAAVGCGALCDGDAGNGERFVGVLSQVAAGVSTTFELEVSDGVSTESLATAGPSFVSQPGDANGDGTLDAGDLARVVGELADSNSSSSVGDVRTGSLTGTWGGVDASPDLVLDAADASAAAARAF